MIIQNGIPNAEVKNSPLVMNTHQNDAFSQGSVIQQSLKYLCPQNADLIKLLLRDCLKAQYTEKELLQLELQRNMGGSCLLDCYGFGISEIRLRCKIVWEKAIQTPGLIQPISRYSMSIKYRGHCDPDEFLYWTFLLIQQDGVENPYPFTLYKMIQTRRLQQYYSVAPPFLQSVYV